MFDEKGEEIHRTFFRPISHLAWLRDRRPSSFNRMLLSTTADLVPRQQIRLSLASESRLKLIVGSCLSDLFWSCRNLISFRIFSINYASSVEPSIAFLITSIPLLD
jgi:hypothetical protein